MPALQKKRGRAKERGEERGTVESGEGKKESKIIIGVDLKGREEAIVETPQFGVSF